MAQTANDYGPATLPHEYRANQRQCDGGGEQQSHAHVTLYAARGIVYAAHGIVYTANHSTYAGARCFPAATRSGRILELLTLGRSLGSIGCHKNSPQVPWKRKDSETQGL